MTPSSEPPSYVLERVQHHYVTKKNRGDRATTIYHEQQTELIPIDRGLSNNIKASSRHCSRRIVHFSPSILEHDVLHLNDYIEDEVAFTWYSNAEIRIIKRHNRATMSTVLSGAVEDEREENATLIDVGGEICFRGLENKTTMGAIRKGRNRLRAWKAVFAKQWIQTMTRQLDPDLLADAYYEVTEPCQVAAHMMALRDAREVQLSFIDDIQENDHVEEQREVDDNIRDEENTISMIQAPSSIMQRVEDFCPLPEWQEPAHRFVLQALDQNQITTSRATV